MQNAENKQNDSVVDYGLVSIIMPNYNSEKYVESTIKSVLAQTYQNWELLFVDDCSTDKSLEIAKSFNDDRIRIFSMKKNGGAALARNKAIDEAKGRWIAFLDSDDLWEPEKLQKQIKHMQANDLSFTFTDYQVIDEEDKLISTFTPRLDVCEYKDILKHNHIGCLTVIYDADKLGKVYMPTNATKREDVACWLKILRTGEKAHCLHETLAKYKVHSNSVSSNKFKMMKYQWQVYRKVEKLNAFMSLYYLACWAIMGILKYR
jgi:glycosyltransferase involved in cell wall biosynthesis